MENPMSIGNGVQRGIGVGNPMSIGQQDEDPNFWRPLKSLTGRPPEQKASKINSPVSHDPRTAELEPPALQCGGHGTLGRSAARPLGIPRPRYREILDCSTALPRNSSSYLPRYRGLYGTTAVFCESDSSHLPSLLTSAIIEFE